jgi:hypothetical protein
MPEAFAILAVFIVAIGAYVAARLQARDPRRQDGREELARRRRHRTWLSERLALAEREGWGDEMCASLHAEIAALDAQLARAAPVVEISAAR